MKMKYKAGPIDDNLPADRPPNHSDRRMKHTIPTVLWGVIGTYNVEYVYLL